jgi:C-terminal processing protease CtpA/Prc
MKTAKAIVLSIVILIIVGCNQSKNRDFSDPQERKIENLKTFSKLYGYIRYFHPSDEAATIDWDKFLYYGIEQVVKAPNSVDLMNILDSLFLPIAPSIDIFFEEETPKAFDQPDNIDNLVLVSWQHKGVKADPNPTYKSIRLGRLDWAYYSRFGVYQQFGNYFDCGNKKFKLTAKVKTSDKGKGEIEIFGYDPTTGKYYQKSGTFENEELEPFILEDKFDDGISFLILSIRLKEKGVISIDDLKFQLGNSAGHLQQFSIPNNQFISGEQDEIGNDWDSKGLCYKYKITKSDNKTSILLQSTDELEYNSLFKAHCLPDEMITKDLGSGIFCRIPLALNMPAEQPEEFSQSFIDLKNELDQVQLEKDSARSEITRIGAVITAWNICQHFYPYFDLVHTDWEDILTQTLSEVLASQDEKDCLILLKKMTAALEDGHVKIVHPSENTYIALPAIFNYIDDKIVVVATNNNHLQKGDIILELDGNPARELFLNYEELVSGSPQWKRFKALRDFTRDDSTKTTNLKIEREQNVLAVAIDRSLPLPQYERPDNVTEIQDGIYYINLCKANIEEIEAQIQGISMSKGIVFDLRGYPKGNHDVISYMIDSPVQSAIWKIPEIIYPDQENISGYNKPDRWVIEPKQPKIKGKIVFLTNNSAVSYAESFLGIIEYYKLGEIIGSQTAGANGNVNNATLMGGFKFQWTGMKVLKHDDSQHHLIGIKPTIPMEPTINGIRESRDELLEKAIEIVSK